MRRLNTMKTGTNPTQDLTWNNVETVRDYARLTYRSPLFAELAEALVLRVVWPNDRCLVDLGAGIGVSTVPLLREAPAQADVWAVDPARAMVARGRKEVEDPRVRWLCGDIDSVLEIRGEGNVDAAICSATLGAVPNAQQTLSALQKTLKPGGRIGISLSSEQLGRTENLVSPEARAFSEVMNRVRDLVMVGETTPVAPAPGNYSPLPTSENGLIDLLMDLGFRDIRIEEQEHLVTPEDRMEWCALAPNRARWLPGAPNERLREGLRLFRLQAQELPVMAQTWLLISAVLRG